MLLGIIYLAMSGMIFLDFVFRRINDQKSSFVETFYPIKFCGKKDVH